MPTSLSLERTGRRGLVVMKAATAMQTLAGSCYTAIRRLDLDVWLRAFWRRGCNGRLPCRFDCRVAGCAEPLWTCEPSWSQHRPIGRREETAASGLMADSDGNRPNRSAWTGSAAIRARPHLAVGQMPYLPAVSAARSWAAWTPCAKSGCPDGRLQGEPILLDSQGIRLRAPDRVSRIGRTRAFGSTWFDCS